MSMTETHKGKLVKLDLCSKTLDEFVKELTEDGKYIIDEDYSDIENIKMFPEEYKHAIINGEVYKLEDTAEHNTGDYLTHHSIDMNGNIDYVCQFHNGGTCFGKELGEIIEKIEAEPKREETVTISKKNYDYLCSKSFKLRCLESVGVDSWSGYYYAMEKFYRNKEE